MALACAGMTTGRIHRPAFIYSILCKTVNPLSRSLKYADAYPYCRHGHFLHSFPRRATGFAIVALWPRCSTAKDLYPAGPARVFSNHGRINSCFFPALANPPGCCDSSDGGDDGDSVFKGVEIQEGGAKGVVLRFTY